MECLYFHAGPHTGLPAGAYALALHRKHLNIANKAIIQSRYFSLINVTNPGNIPDRYVSHLGCALGHHAHLGQLVLELQGNGRLVAARAGAVQHVGQAIQILKLKVHTACLGGIPSGDLGRLRALPIDGLIGFHCDISRIIHLYYIYARFLIVTNAHANAFTARPVAAHAVRFVFCHARPWFFATFCGDADTTYLQRIFAVWQGVALFCQFVLRAGGEQDCCQCKNLYQCPIPYHILSFLYRLLSIISEGRKTSVPPFSCGERGGTRNFLYIKCHSMAANFRTWASRSMKDVSRVACCML